MTITFRDLDLGQTWATHCGFREDVEFEGDPEYEYRRLRPGSHFEDGELVFDDEGLELREIIAIVEVPGYQRRVIYRRIFLTSNRDRIGGRSLKMTALGAFVAWVNGLSGHPARSPAWRVRSSYDLRRLDELEGAA